MIKKYIQKSPLNGKWNSCFIAEIDASNKTEKLWYQNLVKQTQLLAPMRLFWSFAILLGFFFKLKKQYKSKCSSK